MQQKLVYDLQIHVMYRQVKERIESQGLEAETRWMDYHGIKCPRCGQPFKVYNYSVKGPASVSAFLIAEQNKAVIYSVCKPCGKDIQKQKNGNGKTVETEKSIFEKLPDLKRNADNPMTDDDFKKEVDTLDKIMGE